MSEVKPLLRSALWYLQYWGMNPLFTSIWKNPLHESWTPFYGAEVSREDVVREYNKIIKKGRKPAGVALVPSARSRVVVIDLDIYKTEFGMTAEEVAAKFSDSFIAAITPRGGVRLVFAVPENGHFPHRFTIKWYSEQIGEGGGSAKHPWTMPPSVACVEAKELPDKSKKCLKVKHYYYVLPNGRLVKYPWELPWREPPVMDWEEAKDILSTLLQVEIVEAELVGEGELKVSGVSGVPYIPVPCWRNLEEFKEWLREDGQPPLPPCVAVALGYRVDGDEMVYTGQKVPHGLRFTMGAFALHFLASCIAEFDPEELINYVGENLEDFPTDTGEPLNTKLSRLLAKIGKIVVPKYTGLGSLATNLPPELCQRCPSEYRDPCRTGIVGDEKYTDRYIPALGFASFYYSYKYGRGGQSF